MKILLMGQYPPQTGGVSEHIKTLEEGLSKNHDVTILTYAKLNRKSSNVREIPIINVPILRGISYAIGSFLYLMRHGQDFDIIHAHTIQPAGAVASLYGKLKSKKVVITSHGSDLMKWSDLFGHWYFRSVCNGANKLICVSNTLAKKAMDIGVDRERIEVIYNGIDVNVAETRNNLRKKLGIEKTTCLFVGSLVKQKRPDIFLELASKNKNHNFIIIGSGPLERELRGKYNLENVKFLGSLERKKTLEYIKASDITIIPSDYEGFGLVAIESIILKTPIACRPVGSLKELIPKVFCDKDVGKKTMEILNKGIPDSYMITKSDEFRKAFSKEKMIKRTEDLYKNI